MNREDEMLANGRLLDLSCCRGNVYQ